MQKKISCDLFFFIMAIYYTPSRKLNMAMGKSPFFFGRRYILKWLVFMASMDVGWLLTSSGATLGSSEILHRRLSHRFLGDVGGKGVS